MSEQEDERLGALLRADAPAARDPLFRLNVLERREQKRFRNRSLGLIALALTCVFASWIAVSVGGWTLDSVSIAMIAAVIGIAWLLYAPVLKQLLRRLRF